MQIHNNPQFSQQKAASFGMALKIKPEAREALENTTMSVIEKLQKFGEELKDTKYYNLEIGKDLRPRIKFWGADAYIPPFKINSPSQYDNSFSVNMIYDGTESAGFKKGQEIGRLLEFSNTQEARKAYEKLKNMHSDIDRAVEITKSLEKKQIDIHNTSNIKKEEQEKVKAAADKLFKMFG